ncbi:hypothetical protein Droror1_Dr00025192 [Drosera rotundifolia]
MTPTWRYETRVLHETGNFEAKRDWGLLDETEAGGNDIWKNSSKAVRLNSRHRVPVLEHSEIWFLWSKTSLELNKTRISSLGKLKTETGKGGSRSGL